MFFWFLTKSSKHSRKPKKKDLTTSPESRVVLETLFFLFFRFFGFLEFLLFQDFVYWFLRVDGQKIMVADDADGCI